MIIYSKLSYLLLFVIGLDVLRTDRGLVFYEKKENLSKLWDILAVYAWIDKDVGYCQGGNKPYSATNSNLVFDVVSHIILHVSAV